MRDASLELRRGEFVSIVGRSGSGKSTLMAMLGALTPPTAGKVLLDGTDIWALPEAERAALRSRHIGFVFQFPSLLSNLTAVDNVAVPALLGRTMDPRAARSRAYDLLARVGLENRADAYPGSMSGGEQRRVVVARALINSPPLLLADEPTSDLDEDSEADIIDLLADLQRGEAFSLALFTTTCGSRSEPSVATRCGRGRWRQPTGPRSRSSPNVGSDISDRPQFIAHHRPQRPPRRARPSAWAATSCPACRHFC